MYTNAYMVASYYKSVQVKLHTTIVIRLVTDDRLCLKYLIMPIYEAHMYKQNNIHSKACGIQLL